MLLLAGICIAIIMSLLATAGNRLLIGSIGARRLKVVVLDAELAVSRSQLHWVAFGEISVRGLRVYSVQVAHCLQALRGVLAWQLGAVLVVEHAH